MENKDDNKEEGLVKQNNPEDNCTLSFNYDPKRKMILLLIVLGISIAIIIV